ncbi:MAG: transposase [Ruminococcaceae bacterium]|nr:transposase [Oscillospiraceae bacterium]
MPRQSRKQSATGIYHIMLRGINRQQIFEDNEDRDRFIETLLNYKEVCGYSIYAYCLMGNHIHILIKEGQENLAQVFKRIAGSYVYWYNWKYHRCGHLFQDRYKSEPVEDDGYLLTVLRYIHQNPVKAKLCKRAEEYGYSSMREYLGKPCLTDTEFVLSILPIEQFVDYHRQENDDKCLEIDERFRLTDEEAKKLIIKISKCKNVAEFQGLEIKKRNTYIRKLHEKGMSIRQISRLTGMTKKVVEWNV